MSSINLLTREISLKFVYYGPGRGGKTSSLQYVHRTLKPSTRGQLLSLAAGTERQPHFEFLPIKLPKLQGYSISIQLYTVPGPVQFDATRKLVLNGVDGVVFVADSQRDRDIASRESLENLAENLAEQGQDLAQLPLVFQYNKQDATNALPVLQMDRMLNHRRLPAFETVATTGKGVFEALKALTTLALNDLRRRYLFDGGRGEPPAQGAWPSFEHDDRSITQKLRVLSEAAARAEVDAAAPAPLPPVAAPKAPRPIVPRRHAFSALLPPGPAREAAIRIEMELERTNYAGAIQLAAAAFTEAAAGSHRAATEDAELLHALMLGIPGDRYLRFRESARRAEKGQADVSDALYALFFYVDAALGRAA